MEYRFRYLYWLSCFSKRNLFFAICFLLFFTIPQIQFAQVKKPKIALVLSGGGAKGIAHIPVMQALDSLGIVPDLIIGTSMGSVVGGMYAMGYSGDSIAKIANSAHWNDLLGGRISLTNVSVEEMSEFSRYLIDIDVKNYKPVIKSSLLNDQNLREFLSLTTYPVYNVSNFDNLSIPFRAVTTDIVNGKLIVLDKGSLSLAMRASMSIPGVFKAIPYQNTLLVDGGILDNFPTDIAKSMGADIIIGSDVGDGNMTVEKLENLSSLIFQATMLASNLKNTENKKLCDILMSHYPNLTYSTGDFQASKEIYKQGKIATNQNIAALVALAEKLKQYPQREHKLPTVVNEFQLDSIIYKNISTGNLNLVKNRANIRPFQKYTSKDIVEGIDRAMGTNLFNQITYNAIVHDDKIVLELNASEYYRNQLKASLHFDSFRGFGAVLNYTGRNLLGESSRILVSLDIAEQPRFRTQYQKIFGKEKNWWWRSEIYGHQLTQDVTIERKAVDNIHYNAFNFVNQINRNINALKSYVGVGLDYNYTHLFPKQAAGFSTVFRLSSYYLNQIDVNAGYSYNDLNKVLFATNGVKLRVVLRRSLIQDIDVNFSASTLPNYSGTTNGFTKFNFDYEKRVPLGEKITAVFGITGGLLFEDQLEPNQLSISEYGYAANNFLGGYLPSPNKNTYSFAGLQENELNVSQFVKFNFSLQTNPMPKIFVIPHLDIASVGFGTFDEFKKNMFRSKGQWQNYSETSFLMSTGATVSYSTFLGPIIFDTSWINDSKKVKLFFSIGLLFNPSN
jgi:NTE family protein